MRYALLIYVEPWETTPEQDREVMAPSAAHEGGLVLAVFRREPGSTCAADKS